MPIPFSGGCACGAIRYTCVAEPIIAWQCHCRDCQRASGGACASVFYVATSALSSTGEIKYYEVQAKSGNTVSRGFCPKCGSPLWALLSTLPTVVSIRIASLDDPSEVQPTMDIWTVSAQLWEYLNPALSKVEMQPTKQQLEELFASHG